MKEEKTKVALVTGGNRGIGAGIVEVFAEKGYDIFLVHYGEKEKADAVADIVQNKYGRKCKCMDINLSNSDAAVKILNCVLETYGRIDALLSNAGMGYERYLTTAHVEEIDMIYKVNYRAGILLGREVGKYMKEHNIQGCKGMSWGQAGTTFVAKKIRNPQVVGFEHLYFLHGRSGNNGEQAGNFVLYCSEDGIHWDEGRYLKVRTEGLGAYSNNLVIGKGTSHEKLLIQASHAYKDNQTNVLHWQIIKRKV